MPWNSTRARPLDTSLTLNLEILGQHSGLEAKLLILL